MKRIEAEEPTVITTFSKLKEKKNYIVRVNLSSGEEDSFVIVSCSKELAREKALRVCETMFGTGKFRLK